METICVPFSEIRKKVISLGISEKLLKEYFLYLGSMDKIYNVINEKLALENVRMIFYPTRKELDNEEKYLFEIASKGFPLDYQDYLSKTLFSELDEFLSLHGSS